MFYKLRTTLALCLFVLPFAAAERAQAAAAVLPGFNAFNLPANDDGSTGAVAIGFGVNFFGINRTTLYVNNNGNVTFDGPLVTFTPFGLPSTPHQIIAPFFADVDTRVGNIVTYGPGTVGGLQAFGVNWPAVGYYSMHTDKLNTFQLVLINRADTGAGNFDFEFNYNSIQWNTGDASGGSNGLGGSSAGVGYSNGTGVPGTFYQFLGSGSNGAFLDSGPRLTSLIRNDADSNVLGRYVFSVRDGVVLSDLAKGYWLGNVNRDWRYTNWAVDQAGTLTFMIPGSVTDVIFSANGAKHEFNTVLGQDFTIKSLTVNDPVPVSISGSNTLTIRGSGITVNGSAGRVTINSHLVLAGAPQVVTVNNQPGLFFNGILSGSHGLTKAGSGTLYLTRANNYTGGTTIEGGRLFAASDAALGPLPASPVSNIRFAGGGGTLQIGSNPSGFTVNPKRILSVGSGATATFDASAPAIINIPGVITGDGGIALQGDGGLTLSGKNTYSGGTTVNGGTLTVSSAQALGTGDVSVDGGLLLSDPRQINVGGDYSQGSGGTLLLHVGGFGAGQSDLLSVKGHASLGGTIVFESLNGFQLKFGQTLPVITANGGVSGKFDSIGDGTVVGPSLVYESHEVLLQRLFATVAALTPNQFAVSKNLDSMTSDPKAQALVAFLNTQSADKLPANFDLIAPSDLTSLYEISFAAANVQESNLENRMADIRAGSTGFTSTLSIGDRQTTDIYSGHDRLNYNDQMERQDTVLQASPQNRWGILRERAGGFRARRGGLQRARLRLHHRRHHAGHRFPREQVFRHRRGVRLRPHVDCPLRRRQGGYRQRPRRHVCHLL